MRCSEAKFRPSPVDSPVDPKVIKGRPLPPSHQAAIPQPCPAPGPPLGVAVGMFWALVEGFVHFGIFALLYNLVLARLRS
jgi:hypothetical protein